MLVAFLNSFVTIVFLLFTPQEPTPNSVDDEMIFAFKNAQKAVVWALSNIPDRRAKEEKKLVENDKLIAEVSIEKEINGIRIEATGFINSTSIKVTVYRSYDSLLKDGHIRRIPE